MLKECRMKNASFPKFAAFSIDHFPISILNSSISSFAFFSCKYYLKKYSFDKALTPTTIYHSFSVFSEKIV